MADDCIFCKIAVGKISTPKIFEDANYFCIRDIHPQSTTHLLIIPKEHVASLAEVFPEKGAAGATWVGGLFEVADRVAREQGLLPGGYRSIINTGKNGGQTVYHLHLHILGGEELRAGLV